MKKKLKLIIKKIIFNLKKRRKFNFEVNVIKRKKKCGLLTDLNLKQENMVDELWKKHYGKKISKDWHKYYTYNSSNFNVNYFPEIYFTTNLLQKFNPQGIRETLSDKILTYSLFKNVDFEKFRLPKYYIYNCNGYYYSENGLINIKEGLSIIHNIGEVIIKPTVDTNSGKNVRLLNIKNGLDLIENESVEDVLKSYNKNFIIQERIKPDKRFKALNPSSINTIRVDTYISDSKVFVTPIAMRIGRNGKICDNAHAGGIQIGIKNEKLMKYAMTEFGEKYEAHPDTGIVFENYKIPRVNDMITFAKENHYRIPHMGCIAWDFTVDEDGYIVLIETNINCPSIWFPQYTTGDAFFGENTVKMIENLNKNNIK